MYLRLGVDHSYIIYVIKEYFQQTYVMLIKCMYVHLFINYSKRIAQKLIKNFFRTKLLVN